MMAKRRPTPSLAGGCERGAPPGAEAVSRDKRMSAEHPAGLFPARTRQRRHDERRLEDLVSVGPAIRRDLEKLGIHDVRALPRGLTEETKKGRK